LHASRVVSSSVQQGLPQDRQEQRSRGMSIGRLAR
jgi:hypothetical protein